MNQVDPIKYKEEIHQMYKVLRARSQKGLFVLSSQFIQELN